MTVQAIIVVFGISTNKSLPRWGKVAQRLTKLIIPLYFGVVTDEVVTQSVILFSICFAMTVLPRGDPVHDLTHEREILKGEHL